MERRSKETDLGGSMRLGAQACRLDPNSKAYAAYEQDMIMERHRHRYEFNNTYLERLQDADDWQAFGMTSTEDAIYVADGSGREIVLNELGPGTQLGELALLADIPRTASVMTTADSVFLVLTKRSFMQCLSDHPHIAFNLIRLLVKRTRDLTDTVGDLALSDVYGRVVRLLSESASIR